METLCLVVRAATAAELDELRRGTDVVWAASPRIAEQLVEAGVAHRLLPGFADWEQLQRKVFESAPLDDTWSHFLVAETALGCALGWALEAVLAEVRPARCRLLLGDETSDAARAALAAAIARAGVET